MNKHLKLSVLSLSLSGLLLTSCKKEPSTETSNSPKVKSEVLYDENGDKTDSIAYSYNGDKVSKMEIIGNDNMQFTFEYNGDKIVKKNYFEGSSTTSTEYDKVNYNSDGTISSVEHYTKNGSIDEKSGAITFNYANSKLSKLVLSEITNGTTSVVSQIEYTYTNGNITSVKTTDASAPSDPETTTFTYDSKENYFKKLFSQPALIDPILDLSSDGSAAAFLSANNPASTSISGLPIPLTLTYTTNSNNHLTSVKLSGFIAVKYNY